MTAGLNLHVRFLRLAYSQDDEVGGSNPSGTVLHDWVEGRIEEDEAATAFFQQGLETKKTFSAMFRGNLTFREQDEVEVISPPNHEYCGKRFRVLSKTGSSNHPAQKRNVWIAKLERAQLAHTNEFQ